MASDIVRDCMVCWGRKKGVYNEGAGSQLVYP
jgi:hypothetical protein